MGSYLFNGTTAKLHVDAYPITGAPFTIAMWFEADDITTLFALASLADTAGFANYFRLTAAGNIGGDPISLSVADGGAGGGSNSTAGYSADTWTSGTGIEISSTNRSVFINGGSEGTNASPVTPTSIDRLTIGAFGRATDSQWLAGHVGYVFLWDSVLLDAEVLAWHGGSIPQPENLVSAYDLTMDHGAGPVPDLIGSYDLTITNATYDGGESPPVTYDLGGDAPTHVDIMVPRRFGSGGAGW